MRPRSIAPTADSIDPTPSRVLYRPRPAPSVSRPSPQEAETIADADVQLCDDMHREVTRVVAMAALEPGGITRIPSTPPPLPARAMSLASSRPALGISVEELKARLDAVNEALAASDRTIQALGVRLAALDRQLRTVPLAILLSVLLSLACLLAAAMRTG